MNNYKYINICGYGFVGSAVGNLCNKNNIKYSVFDVLKKKDVNAFGVWDNIKEFIETSEKYNEINYYFICVPTPPKEKTGQCDTTIVESVVKQLYKYCKKQTYILIKSTVEPGTNRRLNTKYSTKNINIYFTPEFLTAANAKNDMYNAKFAMIGAPNEIVDISVINLFKELYLHNKELEIIIKKYEVCELFKYTINCYLSVKVWFFNEIYELSEKLDFDYNELRDLLRLDSRIGTSHTIVPGPTDNKFGFKSPCLNKECMSLRYFQNSLGIPNKIITEILDRNEEFREKPTN